MRERFILDQAQNILFISFAGLKIESRAQVDEFARIVRETVEARGQRVYALVDYEGTEIAPTIAEYYGERIRQLQLRYALTTVRYSSSGFTRSVLRYLGAAVDLESNTFTTRAEAIRAIQELQRRGTSLGGATREPHRGLLGKFMLAWVGAGCIVLLGLYVWGLTGDASAARWSSVKWMMSGAVVSLLVGAAATGTLLLRTLVKPLRQMHELTSRLVVGAAFEPVTETGQDEIGQLARGLNEAASQLRRDIERLSGLYHISLIMGTGTEVSRICELLTGKIARLLGAEMCVILLHDEQAQVIAAQLPAHGVPDEHVPLLRSRLDEPRIAAWVFKHGEPYVTNDAETDPLLSRDVIELLGVRAVLAVPLQAGEQRLGTLEVMNKAGGFAEDDKQLVTIFASQAAQLLVNARLFEQVRESEERHRQIFESALDGLYRSTAAGQLVTVNHALAALLGYDSAADLIDVNFITDLIVDDAVSARLMHELAARGQVSDVECELRRASGTPLPTRISVRAVKDQAHQQVYHFGIVRDVTEQKRLAEQLMISEQLAVVGELVAGVAHEVRNPLCGITATLSAMARRLEDREAVQPFVDVVMKEAAHLNHLMEQLLEHSRPARLDNKLADIGDIIQEVLGEWRSQAEAKQVAVRFECPDSLPGLRLDRRKMHGVFANLLDNALQHTAAGGAVRVAVATANGDVDRDAHTTALRVEVSDTGAGVAPENLHRIFEPFFTTRQSGTGLGLAIVRKTIHDHGGTIAARSEPGQGTTFAIALPLQPCQAHKANGHAHQQG